MLTIHRICPSTKPKLLQLFLDFLYSDRDLNFGIRDETMSQYAFRLVPMADMYLVPDLLEHCDKYLAGCAENAV